MKACARPIYLPQESAEIPPQERRPLRLNGFRTTHAPALFSSPSGMAGDLAVVWASTRIEIRPPS